MSTDGWNPILTVEVGVRVFAYRPDRRVVESIRFGTQSMEWIRDKNPNFAYTHWMTIPDGWGKMPDFPTELT